MRFYLLLATFFSLSVLAAPDDTPRAISGQVAVVADENTSFVANFIITDDDGNPISTTLEGDDAELFQIVAGELSFVSPPDYEFPLDQGIDNNYQVRVNGRDVAGDPYAADVSVTIIGVNEAPDLANQLSYQRTEGEGFVIVLDAEDDEGDSFSFSLSGDDAALFDISDGILTPTTAFDFEAPADANGDNLYQFNVVTTDEFSTSATFAMTLTISNVEEQGQFENSIRTEFEEAQISGHSTPLFSSFSMLDPDDELDGHRLIFSGLLAEDTFVVDDSVDALLSYDTESGGFQWDGSELATLTATTDDSGAKGYEIEFAAADNEAANALLDSIRYQSAHDVPTPSRNWLLHWLSDEGQVTSSWQHSEYVQQSSITWLSTSAGAQFSLYDVDMDGQVDLFEVDDLGQVATYLNGGNTTPEFSAIAESSGFFTDKNLGVGANLAFFDFNNDQIVDAMSANEQGFISFYLGQISGATQSFELQSGSSNPMNLIDVGDNAQISVADIDGDLDGDLFIGNLAGDLLYYKNVGTLTTPIFALQSEPPFDVTLAGTGLISAMADFDNDADVDVLLGNAEGELRMYVNEGTATEPSFSLLEDEDNPLFLDSYSNITNIAVIDVNGDYLNDILISDSQQHYLWQLQAWFTVDITRRDNEAPQLIADSSLNMVGSVEIPFPYATVDTEGDVIVTSWTIAPEAGLTIVSDSGSELHLMADIVAAETQFVLTATLDDGRDQSVTNIAVTVFPLGAEVAGYNVPVISLPTGLTAVEGETVELTAQISDLDGDELTILWQQLSGPAISLSTVDTASISFTAPEVTEASVVRLLLTVSDGLFEVEANLNITIQDQQVAEEQAESDDDGFLGLALSPLSFLLIILIAMRRGGLTYAPRGK